jgi:site-specific recombinase XerD
MTEVLNKNDKNRGNTCLLVPFRVLPGILASASPQALYSILEFFEAKISNVNTRRAYLRAAEDFLVYASRLTAGLRLDTIQSVHIARWVGFMAYKKLSTPTIKLRLAAVRMLFAALVEAQILTSNPAGSVKGPKHKVDVGKTSVLTGDETRRLIESIDCATIIGLRDRAVIATMAYTFSRIGALEKLTIGDVIKQERRVWLRLHEKGGKEHDIPCHHMLESYLLSYLAALGDVTDPKTPLFQTFKNSVSEDGCRVLVATGKSISQSRAWDMLQRRAKRVGIETSICNHTFRATGITAFLRAGGTLERAALIANHASTRTTQLYDRRSRDIAWAEIEQISF